MWTLRIQRKQSPLKINLFLLLCHIWVLRSISPCNMLFKTSSLDCRDMRKSRRQNPLPHHILCSRIPTYSCNLTARNCIFMLILVAWKILYEIKIGGSSVSSNVRTVSAIRISPRKCYAGTDQES